MCKGACAVHILNKKNGPCEREETENPPGMSAEWFFEKRQH